MLNKDLQRKLQLCVTLSRIINIVQTQTDIIDRKTFRQNVFDWKVGQSIKSKKAETVCTDKKKSPFRENEAGVNKNKNETIIIVKNNSFLSLCITFKGFV